MNERDLITRLRSLAGPEALNLDDDAALLSPPRGHDLVISSDMMVEGIHFPFGRIGGGFSERALRVALSDLAAKGARPTGYMLSVAWPRGRDERWIEGFVKGLRAAQESFDCRLMGGDTTSTDGPLIADVTVFGVVPSGQMVTRSGAQIGDDVWYTGQLGLAEAGLTITEGRRVNLSGRDALNAEEKYLRPEPRFTFRKILRAYATACADISDGLLSEAGHIATASEVRLDLFDPLPDGHNFGDDYELLFTASPHHHDAIQHEAELIGLSVTACGKVRDGSGVSVNGKPVETTGYRHIF